MLERHVPGPALGAAAALLLTLPASTQEATETPSNPDPISAALAAVDEDVRAYDEHLVTLANPFLEGRLPGTRGMEIAKEYMEHHFRQAGLEAPFATESGEPSYRQPFPLAGTAKLAEQRLGIAGSDVKLEPETDYTAMSLGTSGRLRAPAVFVGYSVDDGPGGYTNFPEGTDLTGKIAVMFRFEPMDEDGRSLWADNTPWSSKATFNAKMRAAREHGAAGVVLINTPGADDARINRLAGFNTGGRSSIEGPVFMLTHGAGTRLLEAADGQGRSAMELRRLADLEGGCFDLDVELELYAKIEENSLMAENVGGLVPGRGALADEVIVIGAHLDHLGMGEFGSRSGPGELHPGADDNASGSAALILLGEKLMADYAALPEGADARSILILAFSAEESGLNGSFYYVDNPIRPLEQHALMINFDMIGRIENQRLSVTGGATGDGMEDWLAPMFEASGLEIVTSERTGGGSDHFAFMQNEVPILFAIIADFHDDYHTPRDVSALINRIDAVKTVHLFHRIAYGAGTMAERFDFVAPPSRRGRTANASAPRAPRVRFGIQPAAPEGEGLGVLVGTVSDGTSASSAGVEAGDVLLRWDGVKIGGLESWMEMLAEHEPGDEVAVGVLRNGEEITLQVTLQGR